MNRKEVQSILGVARPNGADANDPRIAEALAEVRRSPELQEWFSKLRSFDAAMAACVQSAPVPDGLKESILSEGRILPVPFWRSAPVRLAMAASVALLFVVGGLLFTSRPLKFAEMRRVLTEQAREELPQPALRSGNVQEIRDWLQRNQAPDNFVVPSGLRDVAITGASVINWRGQQAALVFFREGGRNFHLFVIEAKALRGVPLLDLPEFENCGGWKTASWTHDGNAYVLSGMRNLTFVKRFRKSGHWQIAS